MRQGQQNIFLPDVLLSGSIVNLWGLQEVDREHLGNGHCFIQKMAVLCPSPSRMLGREELSIRETYLDDHVSFW